jgi:hypothetical protein
MTEDPQNVLRDRRAAVRPQWDGQVPEQLFARLSAEPVVGDALCGLGDALLKTLDGRVLELVALRVATVRASRYVWAGHVAVALNRPDSGRLTPEEISRIAAGPRTLSGNDAPVVQAVDDLLSLGHLGGATRLAAGPGVLALEITTGFYELVVRIMRGAEPDAAPVEGLETPAIAASMVGQWS